MYDVTNGYRIGLRSREKPRQHCKRSIRSTKATKINDPEAQFSVFTTQENQVIVLLIQVSLHKLHDQFKLC
jgi:hypothetical protein